MTGFDTIDAWVRAGWERILASSPFVAGASRP